MNTKEEGCRKSVPIKALRIVAPLLLFLVVGVLRLRTDIFEPLDAFTVTEWRVPDIVWNFFHALGGLVLLAGPLFYWWGFKKDGAVLIGLTYGGGAVGLVAKSVIKVPRPPGALEPSYGYPSGSAQIALMGWGFLKKYGGRIVVVVILLAGLSRIGLGEHFLSDVIGGWLLGMGCLYAVPYVSELAVPECVWRRWVVVVVCSAVLLATGWNAEVAPEYVGMVSGFFVGYTTMKKRWMPLSKARGAASLAVGFLGYVIPRVLMAVLPAFIPTFVMGLWVSLCPAAFVTLKLHQYVQE